MVIEPVPVVIVVSVDIDEAAVSPDIVMVESVVLVVVVSVFFDSQAVASETIDNTNRADFAKPFMILFV